MTTLRAQTVMRSISVGIIAAGKIVAPARDRSRSPRPAPGRDVAAAVDRQQRIVLAVQHQGRHLDRLQHLDAVARGDDREILPRAALRIPAAVDVLLDEGAQLGIGRSDSPGCRSSGAASCRACTRCSRDGPSGCADSMASASGLPCGRPGRPLVDMIETIERVRSGYCAATTCTIMPPIEAPTMCALVDAERIEQADRIGRHVLQQIGRVDLLALHQPSEAPPAMLGTPQAPKSVERPVSRLSKRMT